MKCWMLPFLLLCACSPKVSEDVAYRCHDVDPGVVWAAAYGAAHVESNALSRYLAVASANRAAADWEDHCVRVTETSTASVRGGYSTGGVLR